MKLKKYKADHLRPFVEYLYLTESTPDELPDNRHRLLPDGTLELMINLGDPVRHKLGPEKWESRPNILLGGLCTRRIMVQYSGQISILGVVFHPEFVSSFLKEEVKSFQGSFYHADLILGNRIHELHEQLMDGSPYADPLKKLEDYLARHLGGAKVHPNQQNIVRAVQLIKSHKGNVPIHTLGEKVYMSERSFRRTFRKYVGLPPKLYSRIIRIKSFLKDWSFHSGSIEDIVYKLGYFDPSHFVNDFKAIAGVPPTEYLDNLNAIDWAYLEYKRKARKR